MDPADMDPVDSALFKIKMDIMLVKFQVLQLKDELLKNDYLADIVNLHINRLKSKNEKRDALNNKDCESGVREQSDSDEQEGSVEGYSNGDNSEEEDSNEDGEEITDEI